MAAKPSNNWLIVAAVVAIIIATSDSGNDKPHQDDDEAAKQNALKALREAQEATKIKSKEDAELERGAKNPPVVITDAAKPKSKPKPNLHPQTSKEYLRLKPTQKKVVELQDALDNQSAFNQFIWNGIVDLPKEELKDFLLATKPEADEIEASVQQLKSMKQFEELEN